jgi:hypothetical protein
MVPTLSVKIGLRNVSPLAKGRAGLTSVACLVGRRETRRRPPAYRSRTRRKEQQMKSQLKIAVAVAVFSLAGIAAAAAPVDLGTAQQRAEEGLAPTGAEAATVVNDSTRPVGHSLGEAQQIAESGVGYTPVENTVAVAGSPQPGAEVVPTFGIGEAQQIAESGQGYTPADTKHHAVAHVAATAR